MVARTSAKRILSATIRPNRTWHRTCSSAPQPGNPGSGKPAPNANHGKTGSRNASKPVDVTSIYTSISRDQEKKRSQERDFLISILSSSPTKRDAKTYLQTFGSDSKALTVPKLPFTLQRAGEQEQQQQQQQQQQQPKRPAVPKSDGSYYAGKTIRSVSDRPQFVQGPKEQPSLPPASARKPHVAIVKLQDLDSIDDATLGELAQTLVRLRALGLISVIVLGKPQTGRNEAETQPGWLDKVTGDALRVFLSVDRHGQPISSVDNAVFIHDSAAPLRFGHGSPFAPSRLRIGDDDVLMRQLRKGDIVVVPPVAYSATNQAQLVDADDVILALTRYFAGIQQHTTSSEQEANKEHADASSGSLATVHRIIVIDPIGGTPSKLQPNGARVFLNLEEEFEKTKADIDALLQEPVPAPGRWAAAPGTAAAAAKSINDRHKANLDMARNALALLPSSASAILTTPAEAANLHANERDGEDDDIGDFGYVGSVGTRRTQNPLIHNLLTDRPVYSPSLPLGRIQPKPRTRTAVAGGSGSGAAQAVDPVPGRMPQTTLLKRGMPLTMFPDPHKRGWQPPTPGGPRLRLTDTCIDLPRLVHLINDSFNRQLDVQDYLARVESSLAGVIIAGEYEGGAILTWERPFGLDEETAYRTGRLVPYLDKFAVLKKSQGAGGVADIVFTAMVRDCLPAGVCWRSRKDNPVNRWYFERSRGTWKLPGVNWTMFWTAPWASVGEKGIWDYEDVCRNIQPSWADQKHVLD